MNLKSCLCVKPALDWWFVCVCVCKGPLVCVSMPRCSFGSREIKCIHLHLLAGVSSVTCWNSNALLPPPETQTTDTTLKTEPDTQPASHLSLFLSLSLSLSLSLCPPSFISLASRSAFSSASVPLVPHVQMSPSFVTVWLGVTVTFEKIAWQITPSSPVHFEWWCSPQWLLLIERLSDQACVFLARFFSPTSKSGGPCLTPD